MPAKVKICGLTRARDAALAAEGGATYLGVVFAGGPRTVSVENAAEVVHAAAGVPVIGVFADQTPDQILSIAGRAGLRGAQLHGSRGSETAARLRAAGLLVWRVARIAAPEDLDGLHDASRESDAVLVEPRVPHALGGTGVSLDLAVAREARARLAGHPMVLAGGLTPDTVAQALAVVRPEVADVSSGVELLPGIKDPDKIARFLEAVFGHSPIP
jgi:phosphoribosylanthranilate isomerase